VVRVLVTFCLITSGIVLGASPVIGTDSLVSGPGLVAGAGPGDRLVNGAIAVLAPPPGRGVWGEAILDDGRTDVLGAETASDGSVTVSSWGAADEIGLLVLPTSPPDCDDDARSTLAFKWTTTHKWYFNARSTPAGLRKRGVEGALRNATRNIVRSMNSCGLADQVGATTAYQGRLSRGLQITPDGACKSSGDGRSVTAFGQLPAGTLGIACIWYRGEGTAMESDVRLNKARSWAVKTTDSCIDQWSIEAVTTHERGHTFGLGHVDEVTHGNLTMSPRINGPCQKSEATLGRGDVLALRSLY
jgi:Matrixin